jgi:hypothetical protein
MGVLLAVVLMSAPGVDSTGHAVTAAQEFSGTWDLDEGQSVLYAGQGGGTLTLVVVDQSSVVRLTRRRPGTELSYSLPADGKAHKQTLDVGEFTRTLHRENGALVFQISFTRALDKATISYTERWSLSDGGHTLTVDTVFSNGAEDVKVFTRKD